MSTSARIEVADVGVKKKEAGRFAKSLRRRTEQGLFRTEKEKG